MPTSAPTQTKRTARSTRRADEEIYFALLSEWSSRGKSQLPTVALVLAVYGGVFTAISQAQLFNLRTFFLPALFPLVPIVLTGWLIYEVSAEYVELKYARELEASLQARHKKEIQSQPNPTPLFGVFRLQHAALSPKYTTGAHRFLAVAGFGILAGANVFCTMFAGFRSVTMLRALLRSPSDQPTWFLHRVTGHAPSTIVALWVAALVALYAPLAILGAVLLREMTVSLDKSWLAAISALKAKPASSPSDERRLFLYCLLPRRAELIAKQALQWTLALSFWALVRPPTLRVPWTDVAWGFLFIDIALYQTRYMVNDFIDRAYDRNVYRQGPFNRSRLPKLDTWPRKAFFFGSIAGRIGGGAAGLAWLIHNRNLSPGVAVAIALAVGTMVLLAMPYESLHARKGASDKAFAAVLLCVALPYGLRPAIVLALLGFASIPALSFVMLGLAAMGAVSSGMAWALQATGVSGPQRVTLATAARWSRIRRQAGVDDNALVGLDTRLVWFSLTAVGAAVSAFGASQLAPHQVSRPACALVALAVAFEFCVALRPSLSRVIFLSAAAVACAIGISVPPLLASAVIFIVYGNLATSSLSDLEKATAALENLGKSILSIPARLIHLLRYAFMEVMR